MKKACKGVFIAICLAVGLSCSKDNNEENTDCKTCRILGTTPEVKERVCSEAEAQALYRRYPGTEISCSQ
ncbi:MAG: hypothetical protein KF746_23845 [Chitinophagaceae bacterium]|nr:hypothetical protein [Chitinophagaceae bacterium]